MAEWLRYSTADGDNTTETTFSPAHLSYLTKILPELVDRYLLARIRNRRRPNIDVAAELLECMTCLGLTHSETYTAGIAALLGQQNPDGSWGKYPELEPQWGQNVVFHSYLHTVLVTMHSLSLVFDASDTAG